LCPYTIEGFSKKKSGHGTVRGQLEIGAGEQKPRFIFHNVTILLYLHTFTFISIFLYTFSCLLARFPSSTPQFGSARVTRWLEELVSDPECQPTRGEKNEGDGVSECNQSLVQRSRKFIAMVLAFLFLFFIIFLLFLFLKKIHCAFGFPLSRSCKLAYYLEA